MANTEVTYDSYVTNEGKSSRISGTERAFTVEFDDNRYNFVPHYRMPGGGYLTPEPTFNTLVRSVKIVFDNGEKKVYAETAIPYGTYDITLKVQSPKYKDKAQYKFCDGYLPRLLDVPHFDGILIHIGNTAKDSAGCILVGENKEVGKVLNSTATFRKVYEILKAASDRGEPIKIEIV